MSWEKSHLGNKNAFHDFVIDHATQGYSDIFGCSLDMFFKPFTTLVSSTGGAPHYQTSVYAVSGIANSGTQFTGADSSGLNPFGPQTLGEGIIYGSTRSSDLDLNIDPATVRTYGLKTPITFVGWGFDQFGYPSPNYNRSWNSSGTISTTAPNTGFLTSGFGIVPKGNQVTLSMWESGPLDLRWHTDLKKWVAPISVYAGHILRAYNSGALITNFGIPRFATDIKYDAQFYDGMANQIQVTGITHSGPRPYNDNYKVLPLSSGQFCFIIHTVINSKPSYGLYLVESPGTLDCGTNVSGSTDPYSESQLGYISLTDLASSPLSSAYGGTSFIDYASGTILIGNPNNDGTLSQYSLLAGTGISLTTSGSYFTIKLSSGIAFISGGINTTITQLQGLTTPLSIAQGGTASSIKSYVDLTTNQTVSGYKTFSDGIRVGSGNITNPSLSFTHDTRSGMYLSSSGTGFNLVATGTLTDQITNFGTNHFTDLNIKGNTVSTGALTNYNYAPLTVRQYTDTSYNNHIQIWYNRFDTIYGFVDRNGVIAGRGLYSSGVQVSGNGLFIHRPTGFVGNTIIASGSDIGVYFSVNKDGSEIKFGTSGTNQITFTTTTGNKTIPWSSGYTGNITYLQDLSTTKTLQVVNGLIIGIS